MGNSTSSTSNSDSCPGACDARWSSCTNYCIWGGPVGPAASHGGCTTDAIHGYARSSCGLARARHCDLVRSLSYSRHRSVLLTEHSGELASKKCGGHDCIGQSGGEQTKVSMTHRNLRVTPLASFHL